MASTTNENIGLQTTQYDSNEKIQAASSSPPPVTSTRSHDDAGSRSRNGGSSLRQYWKSFERTLVEFNLETRGIERVPPTQRQSLSQVGVTQVFLMWISINLAANNLTLGMLGPSVFALDFTSSCLCAVLGAIAGSVPTAYIVCFGPRSGNRTLIFSRYVMGWYPVKLVVLLTLIILLGYCVIDAVIAGQILSAVSPNGNLSIIVGIVIVAVISFLVTSFGYDIFHYYERYAWLPQLIVICIMAGVAGPKFDLHSNPSEGLSRLTIIGNRLSFFSICFSAAITYACGAADWFVYLPEDAPRWKLFWISMAGLAISFTVELVIGIGLGSGIASNAAWADAYGISQGALAVEAFRPLGGFGSFCSVVLAFGLVANIVAPAYSAGIDFQILSRQFSKVPRIVWNALGAAIYTVCAIAGRAHLAAIFTNFLALMGYWVSIWIAIVLEEHFIFRKWRRMGWNWEAYNDRAKVPVGISALVAFLIGWGVAILCMAQVWYIGPLAALIGEYGGDMGNYAGFSAAALVYPPMRWAEIRRFGR